MAEHVYPVEMTAVDGTRLRLKWNDGHESVYPPAYLRFYCSCAHCVNETTGVRAIREKDIPANIHPLEAVPVGRYAVQIKWSDGHSTGIYSFEHLRRICPCTACRERAAPP